MAKVNPNNENEAKSDIFSWDMFKSDTNISLSKNIKIIPWLSKSKFLSFMTKVNPKNGNETKPDIFPWDVFKSNSNFFLMKKYQNICKTFKIKSKLLSFMTKVNPSNGNEKNKKTKNRHF